MRTSLADGESIVFQPSFKPSHYHTNKHTQDTFGGGKTIAVADVLLALKTLKSGKAGACDEHRPEML